MALMLSAFCLFLLAHRCKQGRDLRDRRSDRAETPHRFSHRSANRNVCVRLKGNTQSGGEKKNSKNGILFIYFIIVVVFMAVRCAAS